MLSYSKQPKYSFVIGLHIEKLHHYACTKNHKRSFCFLSPESETQAHIYVHMNPDGAMFVSSISTFSAIACICSRHQRPSHINGI